MSKTNFNHLLKTKYLYIDSLNKTQVLIIIIVHFTLVNIRLP